MGPVVVVYIASFDDFCMFKEALNFFPLMSSILPSTVLRLSDDLNVASLAYAP